MNLPLKKVRNCLVIFFANVVLYHLMLYLGVLTFGSLGVENIYVLLLLPGVVYATILLLYERVITKNYGITTKSYWYLTVVPPSVVYFPFWGSFLLVNLCVDKPVESPWYFIFFGIFFFFTDLIIIAIKAVVDIRNKVSYMTKNKKEWLMVGVVFTIFWLVITVLFLCDLRSCQIQPPTNM